MIVLEVGLPPSPLTVRGATTSVIERNEMKQSRRTQYMAILNILPSTLMWALAQNLALLLE